MVRRFCWRYSNGHFCLQHLYCRDILNIPRIVKSQTKLQVVGLYIERQFPHGSQKNILDFFEDLLNGQLHIPMIFSLEHAYGYPIPFSISIFPGFYSIDRRAEIPQLLVQSFCKDRANDLDEIYMLAIFLIDSSDLPSTYLLAKEMDTSFKDIRSLSLHFKFRCEIVSFLLTV